MKPLFLVPERGRVPADIRCTRCGAVVVRGEWGCADGQQHVVAPREYRIETGFSAQYGGPRAGDRLGNTSKHVTIGPGRFVTSDPELQAFLDKYPGVLKEISGTNDLRAVAEL